MFKKRLLTLVLAVFLLLPAFVFVSNAQALNENDLWGDSTVKSDVQTGLGYENATAQDPRVIAANVIRTLLGFLGILAVVLIIYGGFLWMTAGGNEDQVKKATSIMRNGAIGLLIILAAWGIATFAINALNTATGSAG